MIECPEFNTCPFFIRFSGYEEFNFTGFKNMYCRGPLMRTCSRAKYKERYGTAPADELAPSGIIFTPRR